MGCCQVDWLVDPLLRPEFLIVFLVSSFSRARVAVLGESDYRTFGFSLVRYARLLRVGRSVEDVHRSGVKNEPRIAMSTAGMNGKQRTLSVGVRALSVVHPAAPALGQKASSAQ